MSDNNWQDFGQAVDHRCKNRRLNFLSSMTIQNIHHLNFYWDLLQNSIIDAATKMIPNKCSTHHAKDLCPRLLKTIYKCIKLIQKICTVSKTCVTHNIADPKWITIYNKISEFSTEYDITFSP